MSKTRVQHAVRREVTIDPLRQFLKDNLSDDEKCDSLEQIHVANPVDPAKTRTYRQAEKTGTLGQAANTGTLGQAANTFTLGQASNPDSLEQGDNTDSLEQSAKTEALEKAANTDAMEQAAKTEALEQAANTDAMEQAAKTDALGSAVKNNNLQQSLMTHSLKKAVSVIGSENAATADTLRQTAVASYSGQIETEETLDMNENIDYKTNYIIDTDNPTPFRQDVTDNMALKEKCRDLVELSNKSTIKPRKSKSKKSSSKRYQATENKLTDFIDVQHLLNIGYRNPELMPLIKRVSVINDLFANFSFEVQSELVSVIRIVAKTVKEFDYMKQTASNSADIQRVVYMLLPTLNKSFCGVVLKRGSFLLDPTIRNLVEWNAVLKNLKKNTNQRSSDEGLFDLSSRLKTEDLIGIAKDHPEFRKNIKTILGVISAMSHLDHGGQVEMYKILRKMENIIKDLVRHKTDPEGCQDILLTPEDLTSSLDFCIEKILAQLKASPSAPVECSQCDMDRSHAMEGDDIETNVGSRLEMMSVFDCANWGVEHDRINNLESLIHHLASKKNALEYFWSFQDCVDWSEIARLHSRYRLETIQDMLKMYILRKFLLRILDKVEEILYLARSASYEMEHAVFVSNETLPDAIALSGQIEMLTSGVERYLKAVVVHSGNIFKLLNEYGVVSLKVRDDRFKFLTKPQWNAFNFPFVI